MRTLIILISAFCVMSFTSCATRIVSKPHSVMVVKKTPRHYKIVHVKGKRYYLWNGKHYRKTTKGYVFVRV